MTEGCCDECNTIQKLWESILIFPAMDLTNIPPSKCKTCGKVLTYPLQGTISERDWEII